MIRADQQKFCYTGYILKLFSLNCGPLAGISVHCKKLASDSFQTKPVDNLSDTDINDITNQANPDCSSEKNEQNSWAISLKIEIVMPINVICYRFLQFISVSMFIPGYYNNGWF